MPEFIAMFGLCAILAIYGVFKYTKAETNDYNKFVGMALDLEDTVKRLGTDLNANVRLTHELSTKVVEAESEAEKAQEHCAALRKNQIVLQDKLSRRRPVIKIQGLVPVEVIPGTPRPPGKTVELKPHADTFKKVKGQIKGLTK